MVKGVIVNLIPFLRFLRSLVARKMPERHKILTAKECLTAYTITRSFMVLTLLLVLATCATLPEDRLGPASYAIAPGTVTISSKLREIDKSGCGEACSGFAILNRGEEALRWRLAMADTARKSLDAQYYIWHGDASGMLFLDRLISAADRGVRVRLLVDDMQLKGIHRSIATLNLHPNIEVRTFNPFASRTILGLSHVFEFVLHLDRLNHRMHNKLIVADNLAAIVGGRNIGNEYFGLNEDTNFRDTDLLTIGPIVDDISASFDLYWNCKWAYPPEAFTSSRPDEKELSRLRKRIKKRIYERQKMLGAFDTEPQDWKDMISQLPDHLIWGKARVLFDQPPTEEGSQPVQMAKELSRVGRQTEKEMFIITPYFVPTDRGIETFREVIVRGAKVRILTNSLASNDVVVTNTAYKRYRRKLLDAGVELYELRADAEGRSLHNTDPVEAEWIGLHSKAAIFDREKVYVGTMNFDPRSMIQNTEVGLLVESPKLAAQLQTAFERDLLPQNSWRIELDEEERIVWKSSAGTRYSQPAKNLWQRIQDWLLPAALIEEQL